MPTELLSMHYLLEVLLYQVRMDSDCETVCLYLVGRSTCAIRVEQKIAGQNDP